MTKNVYHFPIDIAQVTRIQREGVAHIGDLKYSVDFDALEGVQILSALDGEVIDVKDDSQRGGQDGEFEKDGNYIEILHTNGEISEYEHIKFRSAKVKIGDQAKTGQIIAEVGNTGWSECPHLHFMVYQKVEESKTLDVKWDNVPPL